MLYFFIGLILIVIGITMLVRPKFIYELTESWKHGGGMDEPSALYLFSTRFGGVMFILAGIGGLIVPFLE